MSPTRSFLIGEGAAVDVVDRSGDTPLIDAARLGHVGAVTLLLAAGADKSLKNKAGHDALAAAAAAGKDAVVALLQ